MRLVIRRQFAPEKPSPSLQPKPRHFLSDWSLHLEASLTRRWGGDARAAVQALGRAGTTGQDDVFKGGHLS